METRALAATVYVTVFESLVTVIQESGETVATGGSQLAGEHSVMQMVPGSTGCGAVQEEEYVNVPEYSSASTVIESDDKL